MTRTLRRIALLGGLLTLLLPTGPIDVANAAILDCGSVVTQNTTLEADVGPCSNGGLFVTGNNITLDLNGHRVFGNPQPGDGIGIHLFRTVGVSVKHGIVSDFNMGVAIEGGSGNLVQGVQAHNNIGSNTAGGDGIAILSSQNNRVFGNSTVNNGPFSGIGLYTLIDSSHPRQTSGVSSGNVVEANDVIDNIASRDGIVTNTDNDGIRVEPNSAGNFFLRNRVIGNGLDGIVLFVGSSNSVIRGNIVSRNGLYRTSARRGNGIGLQSLPGTNGPSGNTIEGNLVTENGDNGIVLRGPRGGALGATNNRVINNTAVNNGTLPLLGPAFGPAFDLNDNNPNCDNNIWRSNRYITAEPACTRL